MEKNEINNKKIKKAKKASLSNLKVFENEKTTKFLQQSRRRHLNFNQLMRTFYIN